MENISYFNQVITARTSAGIAEVRKTYDKNFLNKKKGRNYKICVDKFKTMLTALPTVIFDTSTNAYTLELTTGALTSGRISLMPYFYSVWSTSTLSTLDPKYYYIYHHSHFIDILNKALVGAFGIISALPAFPAGNTSPFFYCDETTHILKLYVSPDYLETSANRINIYFNNKMSYSFLDGVPKMVVNSDILNPAVNGRDDRLLCLNKIVNTETIGGIIHYIQSTDSMSDTIIKWNVCKGIVITTNLRIRQEAFPEGERVATSGFVNNSNLSSYEILMNFDLLYGQNARPQILNYVANSYDKLIDIITTEDSSDIHLKFFWYDKDNVLYPLTVHADDTCSIRLAFVEV